LRLPERDFDLDLDLDLDESERDERRLGLRRGDADRRGELQRAQTQVPVPGRAMPTGIRDVHS